MANAAQRIVTERDQAIHDFLTAAGWSNAVREAIPGDASFRRYERLRRGDDRAILMDAPPERENTGLFVNAQCYFEYAGQRVPKLLYGLPEQGLLLQEDFGDLSVTRALVRDPASEEAIYRNAVDVLAGLAKQGLSLVGDSGCTFAAYDGPTLLREVELLPEWLLPVLLGENRVSEAAAAFRAVWRRLIADTDLTPELVVHRDYHADNLFLLERPTGVARIGMLDFQDAVTGRAAYDLVSLLADARRDVSPAVAETMIARFMRSAGRHEADFRAEYAFYHAQRNAKILGIFARLFRRDGKARYLDLLPRVHAHFAASLRHPSLIVLRKWHDTYLPPDILARLPHLRRTLSGA